MSSTHQSDDTKFKDAAKDSIFLQVPADALPYSYPARFSPTAENTVVFDDDDQNTTESTTCAAIMGECIRNHLDDDR